LVKKFNPTTTVLVCGENDLWDRSPQKVFQDFQTIVTKINNSGSRVIYMGTKPEPDTKSIHNLYREYDELIRNYYNSDPSKFVMVDVYPSFETLGNPNSLYANDKLHLSNKPDVGGYSYWNTWLQSALDSTDCARWQDGSCVDGETSNNNDDNGNDDDDDELKGDRLAIVIVVCVLVPILVIANICVCYYLLSNSKSSGTQHVMTLEQAKEMKKLNYLNKDSIAGIEAGSVVNPNQPKYEA